MSGNSKRPTNPPDLFSTKSGRAAVLFFVLSGTWFSTVFLGAVLIEKFAADETQALQDAKGACRAVDAAAVDPANDGKVVYLSGLATAKDALRDDSFGITAPNALALKRKTLKSQWKEEESSSNRSCRSYSYDCDWRDELIDSTQFSDQLSHKNGKFFFYPSKMTCAKTAKLGAFLLSEAVLDHFPAKRVVVDSDAKLGALPAARKHKTLAVEDGEFYVDRDDKGSAERIAFETVEPGTYSLVAKQQGSELVPYEAPNRSEVVLARSGVLTAKQLFVETEGDNEKQLWIKRITILAALAMGVGILALAEFFRRRARTGR